jgi:hypothetical protein
MATDKESIRNFREAYLGYLDGERDAPPSMEGLSDSARRTVELWLKSLQDARGIDPFASRPSAADLHARIDSRKQEGNDEAIRRALEEGLRNSLDEQAFVSHDGASIGSGFASRIVIHARGLRIRVVLHPDGGDLGAAFRSRLPDVAALFGAFPDTSGILISTSDHNDLRGTVVDRYDVVSAIETPSGREAAPRLGHEVTDAVAACTNFVNVAMPAFGSFRYVATAIPGQLGQVLDIERIAREATQAVVESGARAKVEAKRAAWSTIGESARTLVSRLMEDALQGPVNEHEYRRQLEDAVEAA